METLPALHLDPAQETPMNLVDAVWFLRTNHFVKVGIMPPRSHIARERSKMTLCGRRWVYAHDWNFGIPCKQCSRALTNMGS